MKTHGSSASRGAARVLDRRAGQQGRFHVRSIAGLIAVSMAASLLLTSALDTGQALAQTTQTPLPTKTPTRVPPTATPFPCNTGSSAGMTYTYADLHRWNSEILSVSQSTGVPANVLKAIMWVESRGMLNARSPLTAYGYFFGLMQVGPTSSVPEYMKSVTWMCDNAYNQVLAGGTEMVNKAAWIGSQNWIEVAGAYFGYGTDVTGTTTNSYMQQFANHATALMGTTPGGTDWMPPPMPTPTTAPTVTFAIGSTISVDADTLNMRNNPGLSTTITRVLLQGESGTVQAGPNRKDNFDWYQIQLSNGSTGWVAGQYMKSGGSVTATRTPTRTPTGQAGSPTQVGSAGGGFTVGDSFRVNTLVNFRTGPGYAGGILRSLPEGTTGIIIGAGRTADGLTWSNVRLSDNSVGWIATDYIDRTTPNTATPTSTPTKPPATATPSPTATIKGSGAIFRTTTRLNIRQSPTTAGAILSTLPTGTLATSLGNTTTADGYTWLRVQAGSITGWVATDYLTATGETAATATPIATQTRTPVATQTSAPVGTSSNAGTVYRTITRLNIRQSPSTSGAILATLPTGASMISLGDAAEANGHTWLRVQAGSIVGWLSDRYISPTGGTASTPTGVATLTRTPTLTPSPSNTPKIADTATRTANGYISGDIVRVDDGPLNFRSAAGTSSSIIGTLPVGTSGMVLNGPTSANGMNWYQLQITGRPNGWVAGDFLGLVSASVVNGSDGQVEAVGNTIELTATPTATPTPTATAGEQVGQTETTASPSSAPSLGPSMTPTEEIPSSDPAKPSETALPAETQAPAETVLPVETQAPAETALPTETPIPTETLAPPTETPVPPTETPIPPTETPTPTLPPDTDGDGVEDALDGCAGVADSGLDSDGDGIDDACDPTPLGEPTVPPVVERSFDVYAAADTSVSMVDPAAVQPGDQVGILPLGGETGGIAYITLYPNQIGYGQVQNATLYLTGASGSGQVSVSVANGVAIDEYSLTLDTAPGGSAASGAWVDAGVVVPIDLTGWIGADGPVTIIVSGEGVSLGSREGGAPAWLSITVLDSQ